MEALSLPRLRSPSHIFSQSPSASFSKLFHFPSATCCLTLMPHQKGNDGGRSPVRLSAGPRPRACADQTIARLFTGGPYRTVRKRRPRPIPFPALRSLTLEILRRGSLPSTVLLEAKEALLSPKSLQNALPNFKEILPKFAQPHHRIEFHHIEELARKVEMSKQEDPAAAALSVFLLSREDLGSIENYELNLILVEMLIYQGNYQKARDICTKLYEEHQRDPSKTHPMLDPTATVESIFSNFPPESRVEVHHIGFFFSKLKLYQSVTSALMEDWDTALSHWDQFKGDISSKGDEEDDHPAPHHINIDSNEFKRHIIVLKDEIHAVREGKVIDP